MVAVDTVREEKAMRRLTDSLLETYTATHSTERIQSTIAAARERFAGRPVREFLPILVERVVRRELTTETASVSPAVTPGVGVADSKKAVAVPRAPLANPATNAVEPTTDLTKPVGSRTAAASAAPNTGPAESGSTVASAGSAELNSGQAQPGSSGHQLRDTLRSVPVRNKRNAALLAAAAAVVAIVVVALVVRQPSPAPSSVAGGPALTVVRGVVGSEKMAFFEDPRVMDALARNGVEVEVDPAGSRQIATSVDLGKYEFAFPSSAPAAERIQRDRNISTKYTPFSSPMAIATFRPIADLLTAAGVVRPGPVSMFDIGRYLELVRTDMEWDKLPGNTVYPVHKNILVSTTDPRTSNSAAMYLAVASHVANDNTIVQGPVAEQAVLPTVSRLFVRQGYTENSTEGPFREYLSAGMGPTPMVWIYEAQFVEATVRGQIKPDMVLTYPSPTVLSKHTLIPLTSSGDRIGRLLSTDPDLQRLAAEHGFRTNDPTQFAEVTAEHRIPVAADLIDVIDTPTNDTLEHLLDGVTKSYN